MEESFIRQDAVEYNEEVNKRGVIYIGRVPPFMKPNKARSEFEQYGEVTRIFLQEEDAGARRKRKANGGNGTKQYTEGWVEFADKHIAKSVAASLNNTPIGHKKGDFYHDDVWCLKYLRSFKWDYLTEKLAYERRVREAKLKASMLRAKKENAEFVEQVEKNKVEKIIEERKRKREEEQSDHVNSSSSYHSSNNDNNTNTRREFKPKQTQALSKNHGENSGRVKPEILGEVFTRKKRKE